MDDAPSIPVMRATIPVEADLAPFEEALEGVREKVEDLADEIKERLSKALDLKEMLDEIDARLDDIVERASTIAIGATQEPAADRGGFDGAPETPDGIQSDDEESESIDQLREISRTVSDILTEVRNLAIVTQIGGG